MTTTPSSVLLRSNCSVPRKRLGVWCGIWRIVNAYKLALSKPRIYFAAGIRTSVAVQPPLRARYLRTASWACCRRARDCVIVGCAGTKQFLQGSINETSCWQPWSAWAQKQARGCIQWQSAGLADSKSRSGPSQPHLRETPNFHLELDSLVGPDKA